MSRSDVASRIKEAAILVVAEEGLSNLSVSAISARAGVTEARFHEHWSDAWSVLIDAFDERVRQPSLPDKGRLLDDLVAYALAYHAQCADPPFTACMFQLLAEMRLDASLLRKLRPGFFVRRGRNRVMIDRAVARGELPPDVDGDAILDGVLAFCVSRIGVGETPPEPDVRTAIGRLIDKARDANIGPRQVSVFWR
jgi:AcrR family transcriptional regulator